MKSFLQVFLVCFSFLTIQPTAAQDVASYYFNNTFAEYAGNFPALSVTGETGNFVIEIVPKLGNQPRYTYKFPRNSGLAFNYVNTNGFLKEGSYTIEMYFRYDDADLMIYGQIIDNGELRQGQYVHLVTSRNAKTKKVNIFLDGRLKHQFIDTNDDLSIEQNAEFIFFTRENSETTSGAVAMIKIYNYFIEEEDAEKTFEPFIEKKDTVATPAPVPQKLSPPDAKAETFVMKGLYFVQSEASLTPESVKELEALRDFLQNYPNLKIAIYGHTDNQGDFDLNLKLSRERAESVKNYLVENGIAADRITTKGYGSTRPVGNNYAEETRKLNRRVEFEIIYPTPTP